MQVILACISLKTIHARAYAALIQELRRARKAAGITQIAMAKKLRDHQSFVSKYETGERRLDVLEYLKVAEAIGIDPCVPLKKISALLNPGPRR